IAGTEFDNLRLADFRDLTHCLIDCWNAEDFERSSAHQIAINLEQFVKRSIGERNATSAEHHHSLSHRSDDGLQPSFAFVESLHLLTQALRHRVERIAECRDLFITAYRQTLTQVTRSKFPRDGSDLPQRRG